MKKGILFISLLVLMLSVAGCKKAKETDSVDVKGRYVESSVSLPKEVTNGPRRYSSLILSKKNGMPFLYVLSRAVPYYISGYQMNTDGTWAKNTPKWLENLKLSVNHILSMQIFEGSDGNSYLYYVAFKNDGETLEGHLLHSIDGITSEKLYPPGWANTAMEKNYLPPNKITVLENGMLAALFNNKKLELYNGEDLTLQDSMSDNYWDLGILNSIGQSVIMAQRYDEGNKVTSIDTYDTSNNKSKTSFPIQSVLTGFAYLDVNDEGDLFLCKPDGIHVLEHGNALWQTVVDGTATSLAMPTLNPEGFITDSNGNYYLLHSTNSSYSSDTTYSLLKYQYDPSIPSVPSQEITIYSLTDSPTIRLATTTFQQKHPDIKVSFTIRTPKTEYGETNLTVWKDQIGVLNTELLAGKGPDILVLDGLPVNSYIEKGLLADISDILQPLINKGNLYPNIMNNYRKGNKIFHVPARFQLQLLFGRSADVRKLTTIDALSDYAVGKKETSLLGNMTLSDFITLFSPYLSKKVMDNNGQINKENLVLILKKLKIIADNCGIKEDSKNRQYPPLALAADPPVPMALTPCNGFIDAAVPLGITSHVKGTYTLFENSFTPNYELGMMSASSHQDLAREFITYVLSEGIQGNDLDDGFSINPAALSKCSLEERDRFGIDLENNDGSYKKIILEDTTYRQTQDLVKYCSTVSNRAIYDEHLLAILKEETKKFFVGTLSAEKTAKQITEKAKIRLIE